MKYVVRHLLPICGSKYCALSSTQIERHSVTNWCPVALIGAIAGSTGKCCKQCREMRNPQGTKPKSILNLNSTVPLSNACSKNSLLRSRLPNQTGLGSWPEKGTKRRVMTACPRLLLCLTSASVDTSPAWEKHGPSLVASGKTKQNQMVPNLPKESILMVQT